MSFYVKRTKIGDGLHHADGDIGWTGPIRTLSGATREATAWNDAVGSLGDRWSAEVVDSTPEVRAEVRRWQRTARMVSR